MLVPEFRMNWNFVEPGRGEFNFDPVDALAAFASAHGKKLRGHTLLWHLGTPQWVIDSLRDHPDWNLIARYFGSVIPRYGDVISQWEVVNEPLDPGHRMDGLRESIFLAVFGPEYINRAFEQARIFAPDAQLMINEFGFEYDLPEERDRRYLMLKGHVAAPAIATFFQDVANLGLPIYITELDVKENDLVASVEARDRMVGDEVRRYLDVALSQRGVNGVTTWGLSTRHSWLKVTPEDYARFPGAWADGSGPGLNRGLPFDSSMHPMPMYFALRDALWSVRPPRQRR
jgi:endo-1,4-beta-xylanase